MKTNFLALPVLLLLWLGFTPLAARNRNQIIKAVASDRPPGDLFGHSVATNGTRPDITNGNAALTIDQRGSGFSRTKKGKVDIGAYESTCISTLTVNDLGDGVDATPGDGICATSGGTCTLRAAIQEANALSGCSPITISFSTNGTITLGSALPDGIGGTRIINGNGPSNTIIQANANENTATYNIFNISSSTANWTWNNLTIRHGQNDASQNDGGGLRVTSGGTLTVSNCIVEKCRGGDGGAIFCLSSTLNITNCTIRNNHATNSGGGIYCQNSQFTLTNSTITNNQSNSSSNNVIGGGIASLSNALTMTGTTVSNNTVTGSTNSLGGAMYLTNINPTDINITDCIFSGNSASPTGASTGRGGGIYFVNASTGNNNITDCMFTGNSASPAGSNGNGGGIYWSSSNLLTLTNTVFSTNTASQNGGGIYATGSGALTLNNVTINGNTSTSGSGGGIYQQITTTNLNNTLISNNTGGDYTRSIGTLNAQYSLIEEGLSAANGANTANRTGDPALNPDLTLTSGSLAVGGGSNALIPGGITTDLAGNARIQQGTVDIGAYESAFVGNTFPSITAGAALTRQRGSAGTASTIATVSDTETAAGSLTVTATTVPSGLTVTSMTNAGGTITATVTANCTAAIGANTVVLTVTDGGNLTATANLTVNVTENAPAITCPTNISVNNTPGQCGAIVTFTTPTGTDNCPGSTTTQTTGLPSGATFPVGVTTNTFRVTASNGAYMECSFTVTVTDNELPTISCSSNLTACEGSIVTFTAPAGSDNCPGAITLQTTGLPSGSVYPVGVTTNTFQVTSNGQTAACSFTVTVYPRPTATISGTASVCQNAPATITFIANGGTPPYTFTYQVNGGSSQTVTAVSGNTATVNSSTANTGIFTYTLVSVSDVNCSQPQSGSATVTVKPTPTSNLTASKVDVCPNTEVTLNPNCSIPTATVNWNPGAPTVTPAAATLPYSYKASCSAEGCVGNESSIEVRTHRILVDMKDLDTLPLPIERAVKDNLAPTNLIEAPVFPRRWTFIANGCDASESAVFKLSGPVNFSTIDNAATYAMFANDAGGFYSLDHPNYGNGGSFPNGTYTLIMDMRSADGVGGPFPKNRVSTGSLLASRTLQFTVVEPSHGNPSGRQGSLPSMVDGESWVQLLPNPVTQVMRLQVLDVKKNEIKVSVLDASGRMILQRNFVSQTNLHQEEFEVSHLANGMYFMQVKTADKQTTLKVIKVE